MRPPILRLLSDELVVDNFAGGGGASTGIGRALGRSPDIAINHDPQALAMHEVNHPSTRHFCESVWDIDPVKVCGGRPVGLAWFSPDCTFHSKARGAKPFRDRDLARRRRGLAWVVVRWAEAVKPRVIALENVEEFEAWGPLDKDGLPDAARKGFTFRRWKARLENLGYVVEHRQLRACDYGAPTSRKRLFVVARCDGQPIVWPEPTHGPGRPDPYRVAADCIDWSVPCPSIFDRERPLAENTCRRIARGIDRYVLKAAKPFIVPYHSATSARSDRIAPLDAPLPTQDTSNRFGLVAPIVAPLTHHGSDRGRPANEPFPTITCAPRGEQAVIAPILARIGQTGGNGGYSNDAREPLTTVTTKAEHLLVAPTLIVTGNGERDGQAPRVNDIRGLMRTVTASGSQGALVAAFLAQHNTGMVGHDCREPLSTTVSKIGPQALVSSHLLKLRGSMDDRQVSGQEQTEPMPTITAEGTHIAEVRAFLVKYYGVDQDPRLEEPMHTVTTRDRFALVTVMIEGVEYAIVDIGMRMLTPRELFRAQGFPDRYAIDIGPHGEALTKTAQVRMCGNSVPPPLAAAIIQANMPRAARKATA